MPIVSHLSLFGLAPKTRATLPVATPLVGVPSLYSLIDAWTDKNGHPQGVSLLVYGSGNAHTAQRAMFVDVMPRQAQVVVDAP